jgi:hypothetical protein
LCYRSTLVSFKHWYQLFTRKLLNTRWTWARSVCFSFL